MEVKYFKSFAELRAYKKGKVEHITPIEVKEEVKEEKPKKKVKK